MAENRAPKAGREFSGNMRQRRSRRKSCAFCAEKVESIDDLQKMSADFEAKFEELDKKYPDYKPTDEENTKLLEAQQKFEEACQKKAETLVSDMLGDLGDGDDPGEPEDEAEE